MPASDYRPTILAMVHALRVDPTDEITRMAIADLIEEQGRPEAIERTVKPLRSGLIVANSLDVDALYCLYNCRFGTGSPDREFVATLTMVIPRHTATMTSAEYFRLWSMAWTYRRQIGNAAVLHEAASVHDERIDKDAEQKGGS